jgi:hypothetical protein
MFQNCIHLIFHKLGGTNFPHGSLKRSQTRKRILRIPWKTLPSTTARCVQRAFVALLFSKLSRKIVSALVGFSVFLSSFFIVVEADHLQKSCLSLQSSAPPVDWLETIRPRAWLATEERPFTSAQKKYRRDFDRSRQHSQVLLRGMPNIILSVGATTTGFSSQRQKDSQEKAEVAIKNLIIVPCISILFFGWISFGAFLRLAYFHRTVNRVLMSMVTFHTFA